MDPATAVLLAVIVCMIPIAYRAKMKLDDRIDGVNKDCRNLSEKVIEATTKLDMLLDHSGFDVPKTNRKIKESMEELRQNDKPSIGCINIQELYKSK